MKIRTTQYSNLESTLPQRGQHILAHQSEEFIVVYQAYNHSIADFALQNQYLGGSHFSYSRMSWIKPNFLWMMFRCGWASKENQERVLAIWLKKIDFDNILSEAVFSSFKENKYESFEEWRQKLDSKEVRLQWDPDHDPFGQKLNRRAIQLGLKGKYLEHFGKNIIQLVEDITPFVKDQKRKLDEDGIFNLVVPLETIYKPINSQLYDLIDIEK
jgi:hypothetical protein